MTVADDDTAQRLHKLEEENRLMKACLAFTWSAIVFGMVLIAVGLIW